MNCAGNEKKQCLIILVENTREFSAELEELLEENNKLRKQLDEQTDMNSHHHSIIQQLQGDLEVPNSLKKKTISHTLIMIVIDLAQQTKNERKSTDQLFKLTIMAHYFHRHLFWTLRNFLNDCELSKFAQ